MRKMVVGLVVGLVVGMTIPVLGGESEAPDRRVSISKRIRKLENKVTRLQRKTANLDATGWLDPIAINRRFGCDWTDPVVWELSGIGC